MQLTKQKVIPAAIIFIISIVGIFKITPLGVVIDSIMAYFTGSTRYIVYLVAMLIGVIYAIYPHYITQKRLIGSLSIIVGCQIVLELFVVMIHHFDSLPTITELITHYLKTGDMLMTGGGLIGLLVVTSFGKFISFILSIGLFIIGIILILDKKLKRQSKPKQRQIKDKVKPDVEPIKKDETYKPVQKPDISIDEAIDLLDHSSTDDTVEKDLIDDDLIDEPYVDVAPVYDTNTNNDIPSLEDINPIPEDKILIMRSKIETVLHNYDLPLEYVTSHRFYNDQDQVVYEFEVNGSEKFKPSELKAMKFDIEMGVGVQSINLYVPFEQRIAVGIGVDRYEIEK